MTMRLASAPVTWGVWERTVDRDDLAPPELLLDNVRGLGYGAIELGPLGYFGADAAAVRERLGGYGLDLVGAFVALAFTGDNFELDELRRVLAILRVWPSAVVLLADAGTPERFAVAGRPEELQRTALRGAAFDEAASRLARAVELCSEAGVTAALHPEVGSYAEAPAEVEAFLDRVDLGVCLDTGHTLIGGGDPVALARDWAPRLRHVHLKDVSGALLERLRRGEVDVESAWAQGLFCPFGEGEVDLPGALSALDSYDGWFVLEQDRIAVSAADLPAVRLVEQGNLEVVQTLAARA